MSRVRRLPGLLVAALAVLIVWLERRDPARRRADERPEDRATTPAASDVSDVSDAASSRRAAAGDDAHERAPEPVAAAADRGQTSPAGTDGEARPDAPEAGAGTAGAAAGEAATTVPAGAVAGDGTAECPDSHPIKGNASSMIYHEPGRASYARTVAEYCFESTAAAEAAGYRAPHR